MAKIVAYENIPLDNLVISRGQVRTHDPKRDIDSLVKSIAVQGLLHPIVVCPARESGKWEILTGQRRFFAHQILKKEDITAAIVDQRIEEHEAKAISITENLIRRKLSGQELLVGITYLYDNYKTAKAVAEATGLPYQAVLDYVKYPRLVPELKRLVDLSEIDMQLALKAQDSATGDDDQTDVNIALTLAREMAQMTGPQRKKMLKDRKTNPQKPVDELIEDARTGSRVTQVVATVTQDVHDAVERFAADQGSTQDEAAAALIEEALTDRGLLGT